jgi:hypothetical protein
VIPPAALAVILARCQIDAVLPVAPEFLAVLIVRDLTEAGYEIRPALAEPDPDTTEPQ